VYVSSQFSRYSTFAGDAKIPLHTIVFTKDNVPALLFALYA